MIRESSRRPGRGAVLVAAAAIASGCAGAAGAPPPPASPPGQDERTGWAVADAAARAGVPRDQVVVVAAGHVTWADGALGCPQPGMIYTQALAPGFRIVLQVAGRIVNYHASERGRPFLCPAERVQPPAAGTRPD